MKKNFQITLKTLVIFPFFLLLISAVGLTGYLSFENGKKAVGEQSSQLRNELTLRVKDRIMALTGQLISVNQTLANDFDLGHLTLNNSAKLRRIFLNKLSQFKEVSMGAIGTENGSDYGLSRNTEGQFLWFESDASTNYSLNNYNIDSQGNAGSLFSATPNYDPRVRPWYTAAKAAGKQVWSKAYADFSSKKIMIAASQPVYKNTNQFAGVVASTFFFSHISNFLEKLEIGKTGNAFVLDRSGLLLSSSTKTPISILMDGKRKIIKGSEANNALISQSSKFIEAHFGSLNKIDKVTQLDFKINGDDHYLQITPFQDGHGLDWLIAIVIPASDFMMQINKNNQITFLLMIIALVISVIVGIFIAGTIVRPISGLNEIAKSLAAGNWEHESARSFISEVSGLTNSLDLMAKQLKGQFENAQELVSESKEQLAKLEKEIIQRKLAEERARSGENALAISEAAMRESEGQLKLSLDAGQIGTFFWNVQDGTHFWDDRMHDIWGLEHGTYQGKMKMDFLETLHPDDADYAKEAISRTLEDDADYNIEYRIIHSDKTIHHIHAFATIYRDSQGQPLRLVGACLDVTERNQLEEQLRRSQKMDAVGQLTGGIAHDFNNILGIVLGNLEIIQELPPGDSRITSRLEVARKNIQRGADITRKLLGFSHKGEHEILTTDVNVSVQNLLSLIAKSLTVSVEVKTDLADKLWTVEIDPGDFEDAILNLSLNARDAMPDGGKLTIKTQNRVLDEEFVKRHPQAAPGDYVLISIQDNGSGMTDDVMEKVFEPFFTTKGVGKGTGLGLSMVYGFVMRSGGFIAIESELGKGTAFQLYIPRAEKNDVDLDDPEMATDNLPHGHEKILIVDDEEGLRDIAAFSLEELGYKTLVANDGPSALKMLEREADIDLLFSDVVMPNDMNAYELAQKALKSHPHLRILLTSGYDRKLEGIASNDEPFLVSLHKTQLNKPYSISELAFAVRKTLDQEL